MPEHWNFYESDIDDAPASVMLDMDLVDTAPMADLPWLMAIEVKMCEPDARGLASRGENERLGELEDGLTEFLELTLQARMIGRITHAGTRTFFYHAPSDHGLEDGAIGALVSYPDYISGSSVEIEHDPAWDYYLNWLYPDPLNEELIRNRQMVMTLYERGDSLGIARPLDHRAHFPDEPSRERFAGEVREHGFEVLARHTGDDEDFPFTLHIRREDRVELDRVDAVVEALFELAEDCEGYYDGWHCKVVKLALAQAP